MADLDLNKNSNYFSDQNPSDSRADSVVSNPSLSGPTNSEPSTRPSGITTNSTPPANSSTETQAGLSLANLHQQELAEKLSLARIAMEGPERTMRREIEEQELKNRQEKERLNAIVRAINKEKETYELAWINLDNKRTSLKLILNPIMEQEGQLEKEEERLEGQEAVTLGIRENHEIEEERWKVQLRRRRIEEEKWRVAEKLQQIEDVIIDNQKKYQDLLDKEDQVKLRLRELEEKMVFETEKLKREIAEAEERNRIAELQRQELARRKRLELEELKKAEEERKVLAEKLAEAKAKREAEEKEREIRAKQEAEEKKQAEEEERERQENLKRLNELRRAEEEKQKQKTIELERLKQEAERKQRILEEQKRRAEAEAKQKQIAKISQLAEQQRSQETKRPIPSPANPIKPPLPPRPPVIPTPPRPPVPPEAKTNTDQGGKLDKMDKEVAKQKAILEQKQQLEEERLELLTEERKRKMLELNRLAQLQKKDKGDDMINPDSPLIEKLRKDNSILRPLRTLQADIDRAKQQGIEPK